MADFSDNHITQRYLRRYPNSERARSWAGKLVHIVTDNGTWKVDGNGYTNPSSPDAWVLPFEEAMAKVDHLGPEKSAMFLLAAQRGAFEMSMHVVSVIMTKQNPTGLNIQNILSSYTDCINKIEAEGRAVREALEEWPNHQVAFIVSMEFPQ